MMKPRRPARASDCAAGSMRLPACMPLSRSGSVMHVICGSQNYGTEHFVLSLAKELDQLGVPVAVMTIKSDSTDFGRIPVLTVARKSRYDIGFLWRMVRVIR